MIHATNTLSDIEADLHQAARLVCFMTDCPLQELVLDSRPNRGSRLTIGQRIPMVNVCENVAFLNRWELAVSLWFTHWCSSALDENKTTGCLPHCRLHSMSQALWRNRRELQHIHINNDIHVVQHMHTFIIDTPTKTQVFY